MSQNKCTVIAQTEWSTRTSRAFFAEFSLDDDTLAKINEAVKLLQGNSDILQPKKVTFTASDVFNDDFSFCGYPISVIDLTSQTVDVLQSTIRVL